MTCIVGIAANKKVYIGGDSIASNGYSKGITALPKVFRVGAFLIGYTDSFRMGQILQYHLDIRQQQNEEDDLRYLVVGFIEAVRKSLKEFGYTTVNNNNEHGGTFLVGYRGRLYEVNGDFQINPDVNQFAAIGAGCQYALGALKASEHLKPRKRIEKALTVASELSAYVIPPFLIEELS
jgi:ATP-dependent protease HslVU (ClpYQ) peptidase subunit